RAICIRGVNYHFGTGETKTQVLFDNKLDIGRGEVVIMTGPSGSGKTTLLTLVGGLRTGQAGSIIVNNRELVRASRNVLVAHRRPRSMPTRVRSSCNCSAIWPTGPSARPC